MKHRVIRGKFILLIWLALSLDMAAFSQSQANSPDGALEGVNQCRILEDNMQRLLCFDNLFDTPLVMAPTQEHDPKQAASSVAEEVETPLPRPIGDMVLAMERGRSNGEQDWQVHIRRWQGGELAWEGSMAAANLTEAELQRNNSERNPVDIFMTMGQAEVPADGPQSERAVLLISCDNDITTLGVLLPRPINTLSANLSLSGPGGVVHRLNWRNVESGSLVIAGRGLESIDTIKAIANYPRIQFQVVYPDGPRAFIFNMRDLKAHLRPFRIACHW